MTDVEFGDLGNSRDSPHVTVSKAMFEGFQQGRRVWLKAVLPLVQQQLTEPTVEGPQAAAAFKEKLLALQFELQSHPASNGCAPTPAQIQLTVNGQKLHLLRELETIITTRPAPPINFKSWLSNTATRYRAWLDRLN